jgi:methylthioribose-1-phosphate isomerase
MAIDQTKLPHAFEHVALRTLGDVAHAIRAMLVRGAPLIGVTAAYGVAVALVDDASDEALERACETLRATRSTAVNLAWAVARMRKVLSKVAPSGRVDAAYAEAGRIAEEDVACCKAIGDSGLRLLQKVAEYKPRVEVMTHCNAGWLATVDWGTALAPVYRAHDAGIPVHVWVSETRPRNQGSQLTAWELGAHGVPHTIVADNACGHLLSRKRADLCIVGADRVTATGDVANKVGTYLKALAAREAGIPFYVALPQFTIDWTLEDGAAIPIEERDEDEVTHIGGVRIAPEGSRAFNPGFDVTPARLVTAIVTERGTCAATREGLRSLYADVR